MEQAAEEGVHFPLETYCARISQERSQEMMQSEPERLELPEPWTEGFRPATVDDLFRLFDSDG
jgi:hypothetical protein